MYMSDVMRKNSLKKDMGTKSPRFTDYLLQPGGALARKLNHYKQHWKIPVTGSGVSFQLCQWASGENIISQVQFCILCNVNLCVKHFALFYMIRKLVEDME